MKRVMIKLVVTAVIFSITTIRGSQAEEALLNMRTAWKAVTTYSVKITSHQELGSKTQDVTTNTSYKRPGWLKVEVIAGDNKGSVAIYDPGKNSIKVKWGGIGLPLSLSPEAKMAQSLRGEKIYSMTYEHMLEKGDWYIANGSLSWIGEQSLDGRPCAVIEFTTTLSSANNGITRERWWIDKSNWLVRKTEGFDNSGKKVQWARFTNLKLNPGFSEDYFKL